ncbi:hypothetical protein PR048_011838 [Dryococelus australis]|uniref:Helitron helicase-like domain-containing protein n=1 Tax=Dryococelus australis TaxID=614101 RepID=A0ABQ9HN81_9NEOP|nr:hypothetical protein PR048_011838 [Dryococelus australis]
MPPGARARHDVMDYAILRGHEFLTSVPPDAFCEELYDDFHATRLAVHLGVPLSGDNDRNCTNSPLESQLVMSRMHSAASMGSVITDDYDETVNANNGLRDVRAMIGGMTKQEVKAIMKTELMIMTIDDSVDEISDEKHSEFLDIPAHFTDVNCHRGQRSMSRSPTSNMADKMAAGWTGVARHEQLRSSGPTSPCAKIPSGVTPGFSHVEIVADVSAGRIIFSRLPHRCIPALFHTHLISPLSVLNTWLLRAAEISPLCWRFSRSDAIRGQTGVKNISLSAYFKEPAVNSSGVVSKITENSNDQIGDRTQAIPYANVVCLHCAISLTWLPHSETQELNGDRFDVVQCAHRTNYDVQGSGNYFSPKCHCHQRSSWPSTELRRRTSVWKRSTPAPADRGTARVIEIRKRIVRKRLTSETRSFQPVNFDSLKLNARSVPKTTERRRLLRLRKEIQMILLLVHLRHVAEDNLEETQRPAVDHAARETAMLPLTKRQARRPNHQNVDETGHEGEERSEPGLIPGRATPGFSQLGIVPDEASWFSRGSPVSPTLVFRRCSILTSFHPHRLSRPRVLVHSGYSSNAGNDAFVFAMKLCCGADENRPPGLVDVSVRCLSGTHRITSNHDVFGGQVVDCWWRVEFQCRGSSHLHMAVWVKGHPNFETQEEIQMIDCVCVYEMQLEVSDLRELVLKYQLHRHTHTCKMNNEYSECRFNFLRKECTETRLITSDTDDGRNIRTRVDVSETARQFSAIRIEETRHVMRVSKWPLAHPTLITLVHARHLQPDGSFKRNKLLQYSYFVYENNDMKGRKTTVSNLWYTNLINVRLCGNAATNLSVITRTARERPKFSSAKGAMDFTCSEYQDMAMAMGASGGQVPCMLHSSNRLFACSFFFFPLANSVLFLVNYNTAPPAPRPTPPANPSRQAKFLPLRNNKLSAGVVEFRAAKSQELGYDTRHLTWLTRWTPAYLERIGHTSREYGVKVKCQVPMTQCGRRQTVMTEHDVGSVSGPPAPYARLFKLYTHPQSQHALVQRSLQLDDQALENTPSTPHSIPGGIAPVFSHVGNVPDDAAGGWVFKGIPRVPQSEHSGAATYSPRFTLIGSQDLDVKSRPNIFPPLPSPTVPSTTRACPRPTMLRHLIGLELAIHSQTYSMPSRMFPESIGRSQSAGISLAESVGRSQAAGVKCMNSCMLEDDGNH